MECMQTKHRRQATSYLILIGLQAWENFVAKYTTVVPFIAN
jgi:hypothetical protein